MHASLFLFIQTTDAALNNHIRFCFIYSYQWSRRTQLFVSNTKNKNAILPNKHLFYYDGVLFRTWIELISQTIF